MVIICTEGYHGRTTDICLNVTASFCIDSKKELTDDGNKIISIVVKKESFLKNTDIMTHNRGYDRQEVK